jgi:hypothetical protein
MQRHGFLFLRQRQRQRTALRTGSWTIPQQQGLSAAAARAHGRSAMVF